MASALEAAKDADALLVLTDWDEFRTLDLIQLHAALHYPIVIDGRNLFSPETMAEHGFVYTSVGRADVSHEIPCEERFRKGTKRRPAHGRNHQGTLSPPSLSPLSILSSNTVTSSW